MAGKKVPENVAIRLSFYLRYLRKMRKEERTSSKRLAQFTGESDVRVRKDLSYFGQFGIRGKGYEVGSLRENISKVLGLNREWAIALVGVGKLGKALLSSSAFKKRGFHIQVGFDIDPEKVGKGIGNIKIYHPYKMPPIIREQNIYMGIITVPTEAAQESADLLIISGIKAILNFSSASVVVPSYVKLKNVNFASQLEIISYYIVNDRYFHPLTGD